MFYVYRADLNGVDGEGNFKTRAGFLEIGLSVPGFPSFDTIFIDHATGFSSYDEALEAAKEARWERFVILQS